MTNRTKMIGAEGFSLKTGLAALSVLTQRRSTLDAQKAYIGNRKNIRDIRSRKCKKNLRYNNIDNCWKKQSVNNGLMKKRNAREYAGVMNFFSRESRKTLLPKGT